MLCFLFSFFFFLVSCIVYSGVVCSEGVIPLDDLRDFVRVIAGCTIWCKNIPEKLNPLSRVHARHRRQTDRRICHVISQT